MKDKNIIEDVAKRAQKEGKRVKVQVTDYDFIGWLKHPILKVKSMLGSETYNREDGDGYFMHLTYWVGSVNPQWVAKTRHPTIVHGRNSKEVLQSLCEYLGYAETEFEKKGIDFKVENTFWLNLKDKKTLNDLLPNYVKNCSDLDPKKYSSTILTPQSSQA